MSLFRKFLLAFVLLLSLRTHAQLQITPQTSASLLAQRLVGDGIIISNMTINASPLATGYFKNLGGNGILLDSGIVMSTGRVQTVGTSIGLNGTATDFASTTLNTNGDADLTGLSGQTTLDATILEFDFIPLGDTVQFRYIFSSEEYPTFNCSNFNDVFAFFISGPGIVGSKNMALVPGTNIPVSINSINTGNAGSGYNIATCNAMGPGSPFWIYYVNNTGNGTFTHNGHTKVLVAKSAVQPCQTYHLKLAIADAVDRSYDSNVFLEAKSLKSDPIQLESATPLINGLPYLVEGCQPGAFKILRSRKFPYPQPVQLTYGGSAINGVDVQTLPANAAIPAGDSVLVIPVTPIVDNLPEGIEFLKVYVSNGCVGQSNFFLDSLQIQIRDYDTLSVTPKDTIVCRNTPVQLNASGTYVNYQWSPAGGLSNATIKNPIATPGNTTVYVCQAGLNDCKAFDSLRIRVKSLKLLGTTDVKCKNGTTGQIRVGSGGEWVAPVQFNINNTSYISDSTFNNLPVGLHTVRVKDASGCIDSMQVNIVQSFPDLLVSDSIITASCVGQNGQVFLGGSGGLSAYSYTVDNGTFNTSNVFTVTGGAHSISIKDANGCVTTRNITVNNDPNINITLSANGDACNGSPTAMVYVAATGGSTRYVYSADGTNFQAADSFLVSASPVNITVKDDKGCQASQSIAVPINQLVYIRAGNDTTICEGRSFTIGTQSNANTYTWSPGAGLSANNIKNPVAAPVTTTTYYVTGVKDICIVKDTLTVTVLPAPVAYAGIDTVVCWGKQINLNATGGVRYQWSPASLVNDPTIANPTIRPPKTTMYSVYAIDANNCRSLVPDSVLVTITPAVQAFAGRDTFVAINQPLQMIGVDLGNSGVTQFQWTPTYGLSDPTIYNPVATLDKDMVYVLTLTTPAGCQGVDTVKVKAYLGPELYVPSAFTPNGDGRNDLLHVIAIGMKELHYFRVYNRWGQMIFSTTNPGRGWDGTINGAKQGTGTFIWTAEAVDFRGQLVQRRGSTTLIR